jgi:hypothetical protein
VQIKPTLIGAPVACPPKEARPDGLVDAELPPVDALTAEGLLDELLLLDEQAIISASSASAPAPRNTPCFESTSRPPECFFQ